MEKDGKDKATPLLRVRSTTQRAATSERMVVVQANTPASRNASAGAAMSMHVVSSSAGGLGDKPTKRIGAADVEKMLGAEAVAALERMRRRP